MSRVEQHALATAREPSDQRVALALFRTRRLVPAFEAPRAVLGL